MMTKNLRLLTLLLALGMVTSCDNDDETPISSVTFETATAETQESDGTLASFHPEFADILEDPEDGFGFSGAFGDGKDVEVKILLDRELAEEAVISFSIGGTASNVNQSNTSTSIRVNDYEVVASGTNTTIENLTSTGGNLRIKKGVKEGSIILRLYEDFSYEYAAATGLDETVILTLNSVVSGPISLSGTPSYTLTIKEDDTRILLRWSVDGSSASADIARVDMDMFSFFTEDGGNSFLYIGASTGANTVEGLAIRGGFPSGIYALAYTYKSGTSNNVGLDVRINGYLQGDLYAPATQEVAGENYLQYTATYTQANVNNYEETEVVNFAQFLEKDGNDIIELSNIEVPESGSRNSKNLQFQLPVKGTNKFNSY